FYLREEGCLPHPDELPPAARGEYLRTFVEEDPERRCRLEGLKHDVRRRCPDRVRVYTATWDPEADNPEENSHPGRLTRLEDFGDRIEADLRGAIAQELAGHLAAADGPDPLA